MWWPGGWSAVTAGSCRTAIFARTDPDVDLYTSALPFAMSNTKLFRRSLLVEHQIRFPEDLPFGSDQPFTVAACVHARKISVLADYDYYYAVRRHDATNITYRSSHRQRLACTAAIMAATADAAARRTPPRRHPAPQLRLRTLQTDPPRLPDPRPGHPTPHHRRHRRPWPTNTSPNPSPPASTSTAAYDYAWPNTTTSTTSSTLIGHNATHQPPPLTLDHHPTATGSTPPTPASANHPPSPTPGTSSPTHPPTPSPTNSNRRP